MRLSLRTNFVLVAIILVAFFFRFHRLNEIPPGMTHDEAAIGFFIKQVTNQTGFAIEVPYGYANEPFTKYSASLLMLGIGQTEWALRAHQALWGVLLVVFTFKWGSAAFTRPIGMLGAALVAVSFWATMTSRFALNSNPTPALFTGAMWCLWLALFRVRLRQRWFVWLAFALLLAGSLVTYEAARGAWLALPAFAIYLSIFNRQRLGQFLLALTLGTALALPHLLNPLAWGRTGTLAVPLTAAAQGNLEPLAQNVLETFGTLFFKGDPFIVYNLPNRPVLDWVTGALFILGVGLCVWRWREPAYAFTLLWFGAGFAPAAAIGAFTMMLHAITTQAVVMVFPALGWNALRRFARARSLGVAALLLVLLNGSASYRDYFYVWGEAVDTRASYFANFKGVTDFLRTMSYRGSVALSSPFPNLPHDPLAVQLRVFRDDLVLHWFDARESFVFPATQASLLVLPSNTQPDSFFTSYLPLNKAEQHLVRADDRDPDFVTLLWDPASTLAAMLNDATRLTPPINFSGAVELVGFHTSATTVKRGDTLKVVSFWRVLNPAQLGERSITAYAVEANIFLHLVDAQGSYVTGNDQLQVPSWNWRAGDVFAQIHRLQIPNEAQGTYSLLVGVYTLPNLERLLTAEADAIFLDSILVNR